MKLTCDSVCKKDLYSDLASLVDKHKEYVIAVKAVKVFIWYQPLGVISISEGISETNGKAGQDVRLISL